MLLDYVGCLWIHKGGCPQGYLAVFVLRLISGKSSHFLDLSCGESCFRPLLSAWPICGQCFLGTVPHTLSSSLGGSV